jgi:hypothetical protein
MKERLRGKWCPSARRTAWKTGLRAALALLFTATYYYGLTGSGAGSSSGMGFAADFLNDGA